MPTITDVAQTAGVSKNMVSRYLNNRGYMSEKTKAAIQAAIEELHYQPNQIARSLYTSKTSLVGLVIPDVEHPFFSTITARIEDALDTRGYKMILCNTMHSSQKERKYIDMLTANKVDGIIIGSHSVDINYSDINAPIVALDRNLADDIPVVASDHVQGGEIAAQAFIDRGCHKVVQLVASGQVKTPSNMRHEIFAKRMREHSITCITQELQLNQFEFSTYLNTADEILNSYPGLDGVFSADPVAAAIQRQALARGMQVPDDLFIFGYDGTFLAQAVFPPLLTVAQSYDLLARTVVDVLMKRIDGDQLESLSYVIPMGSMSACN